MTAGHRAVGPEEPVDAAGSPARRVLLAAEADTARAGLSNGGPLSATRGFLPAVDPPARLPGSHRAWDELAADLPTLYRSLRLRAAVDTLPALPADPDALPDTALQRAATVLGIVAHAYHRVQPLRPVGATPAVLRLPWAEVCRRLGRPAPALTYADLIVANWRRSRPRADLTVEDLRLLVPTVDNDEERRFYLTQVEMLARSAPLVTAAVRAQEAVLADDPAALTDELHAVTDCLDVLTTAVLPKIDPNPWGRSHVDPVVWAKTVAPLAVPVEPGGPGPSGTSSPLFHLVDVLLGRSQYATVLGDEARRLREVYPPHWRDFLSAVAAVPVTDYVVRRGHRPLEAALRELVTRYVDDAGLLGRHRLKVYGYLELAFKLGRSVTIGGFSGLFRDRTWDEVDEAIAASRAERTSPVPPVHRVPVRAVAAADATGTTRQVVLDLTGSGVRYRPGDRVQVRAENDDRQVGRTLGALRADPDQRVPLPAEWRRVLETTQPTGRLEDVLRLGELRPVGRDLVERLLALTGNRALRGVVESRTESAWELWDLLELVAAGGFDPSRLWRAAPGEPESLCRLLAPAPPRTYSAASSPAACPDELSLTVGRVEYETGEVGSANGHHRRGTASFFLTRPPVAFAGDGGAVPLVVERPPRFHLPPDPATPLLLFAGGTGVSPFRGFLQERGLQAAAGTTWLFLSTRTRREVPYVDELEAAVGAGRLHLRVACTREAGDGPLPGGTPTRAGRVADLLADPVDAAEVWRLLRDPDEGGAGATVSVCGNAGFAAAVADGLRALIARYDPAPPVGDPAALRIRRMVGEGRYVEEVYTTHLDPTRAPDRLVDVSELVLHNGGAAGVWTAVAGRVYDVTEFVHEHPGGAKVLRGYGGMDATRAYDQVGHSRRPDVDAHLPRYEIGALRRLDLGREWGVALGPGGLRTVTLADAHAAWVDVLHLAVEIQNAVATDLTVRDRVPTRGRPDGPDLYGLQLALEVHARFLGEHVAALTGQPLADLWAVTVGLCAPGEDVRRLPDLLEQVRETPAAAVAFGSAEALLAELDRLVADPSQRVDAGAERLDALGRRLHERDSRLLDDVKLALRGGVRVFEELEADTVRRGSRRLLAAVLEPVGLLLRYVEDVAALVGPTGG